MPEETFSRVSIASQTEDDVRNETACAAESAPRQRRLVTFAQTSDTVNLRIRSHPNIQEGDSNLLEGLLSFLSGLAMNWFRGSRHPWCSFVEFARAGRQRFDDQDFQFTLCQEIHRRTQGEKESVTDYLTCMQALFTQKSP